MCVCFYKYVYVFFSPPYYIYVFFKCLQVCVFKVFYIISMYVFFFFFTSVCVVCVCSFKHVCLF